MKDVSLTPSWKKYLASYLETQDFERLLSFAQKAYEIKPVYPKSSDLFKAFKLTPFDQVKVVILGQDPYHGAGQAHGLCFSVPDGITPPPSLKNIYKEIESDLGIAKDFSKGNLESWAQQGVLLLNAIMTVEANLPASHQKKGWEEFTDHVIKTISSEREHVVFLLWGKYAQSKNKLIDAKKHLILEAPHPSPFSVYKGFFGCKHFSQANAYLKKWGGKEIEW